MEVLETDTSTELQWKRFGQWVATIQDDKKPRPSDREIAKASGISATHLGTIKRGESGTKKAVIVAIALALGADPSVALDQAGMKTDTPGDAEIEIARYIVSLEKRIPESKRSTFRKAAMQQMDVLAALVSAA